MIVGKDIDHPQFGSVDNILVDRSDLVSIYTISHSSISPSLSCLGCKGAKYVITINTPYKAISNSWFSLLWSVPFIHNLWWYNITVCCIEELCVHWWWNVIYKTCIVPSYIQIWDHTRIYIVVIVIFCMQNMAGLFDTSVLSGNLEHYKCPSIAIAPLSKHSCQLNIGVCQLFFFCLVSLWHSFMTLLGYCNTQFLTLLCYHDT